MAKVVMESIILGNNCALSARKSPFPNLLPREPEIATRALIDPCPLIISKSRPRPVPNPSH
ncbi:hypothetical protein NQ318_017187 [Aromia moschata]|uniref:Uncharacterized protein n=1 Tax=Aromia moschata TaxID=1265417 RepID=A0AAV8YN85_9CUCU|nr:hypothetical protein NQ318_017187 [Aromia moschata]